MEYINEIRPISMDEFLAQVITMKMEDWRLAQICAARLEDGYEMSYSFCKDYNMVTLRLVVGTEERSQASLRFIPVHLSRKMKRLSFLALRLKI